MMQIRGTRQRRGDRIVHLNSRTLGIVVTTMIGLLLIAFGLGVGTGWTLFGRSVMEVEIRPESASPLAATADAPRVASTDAVAAETASPPRPAPRPTAATASPTAAPARPVPALTPPDAPPPTKRFAIVAGSIAVGDTPTIARAEAEKLLSALKIKGYRSARIEEVTIPNKGNFLRVIAMEANYHTATAARRDVEAMIRRGDLTRGFPLYLGDAR